ncbi:MMPL family protein [bacterium BMS3Abin14]|nr:MMPL family protein [bacterium BMS3Abin14]
MGHRITDFSIRHPKTVILMALIITALSLFRLNHVKVDTDPENMLDKNEWVRVFHNEVKQDFALSDMIVLGVVNEGDANGVFNPATLSKVYRITEGIKGIEGVVTQDIMALSTVDDIQQGGLGSVRFKYLMDGPVKTGDEALKIRDRAMANPLLYGTLVSEDGKALAIYIPIVEKKVANRVSKAVDALIAAEPKGQEKYYITGLPVAEDTFGIEMFNQMGISAPLAALVIFLLMLFFFRKLILVIAPMGVAILTILITMGTLIATGNTVHIMSSMIPIFLMPIAVVDSVHLLSVFFDRYQIYRDREKTLKVVMRELFTPMLYTSLTTLVGFGSLMMAPIPPVKVFGGFVALGVFVAWLLTVTLIPAYIMLFLPESKLENFGAVIDEKSSKARSPLAELLIMSGSFTRRRATPILLVTAIVLGISIYGITLIRINDNPVKWFVKSHPIRIADTILNKHFGGTYEAYLIFEPPATPQTLHRELEPTIHFLDQEAQSTEPAMASIIATLKDRLAAREKGEAAAEKPNPINVLEGLSQDLDKTTADVPEDNVALWDEIDTLSAGLEDERTSLNTFKDPATLRYIAKLQKHLAADPVVGKTNGFTDIIKKVNMELLGGKTEELRIPDSPAMVAQASLLFQGSHNPDFIWHLVTPDYRRLNLWLQLKSGDNRDMESVVKDTEAYLKNNPPPVPLNHAWAGLTYLNVVWQDRMVRGMLMSLASSYVVVLLMMMFLFRSILWGILSMIPLTVTISFIYGASGLIGKDYDMVMAILSSMTLGMSIDFAIHYIERARELYNMTHSWPKVSEIMSMAPARAITRNAIVIAVGFLPLLLSSLTPYKSVGVLLATIMILSGVGTLLILPALIEKMQKHLFKRIKEDEETAVDIDPVSMTIRVESEER